MCGIYACVSSQPTVPIPVSLERNLGHRGPDHFGTIDVPLDITPLTAHLTSTVLSLRGDTLTAQPLVDSSGDTHLCWNGEAWKLHGMPVTGNDTVAVYDLLLKTTTHEEVLDVFRAIEGPFAVIAVCRREGVHRMYFARDRIGRRSLLIREDVKAPKFELCSISDRESGWREVEADGIYWTAFASADILPRECVREEWLPGQANDENMVFSLGSFNMTVPPTDSPADPTLFRQSAVTLQKLLTESLSLRALNIPTPPLHSLDGAPLAVLFSGGLDCTVIARLLSDILPPSVAIDLLNVAFENPRIVAQFAKEKRVVASIYEECPDRVTGRKSFAELESICPERRWRFIAVDVAFREMEECRAEVVELMAPHNTEMDVSIAYALYFASRGRGRAYCSWTTEKPIEETVTTEARVLFSGLGADELFGGYMRHATAYSRRGYSGLADELKLDIARLGQRNLGRDDRVLSHWGREVRFPFLDEELVRWAVQVPVEAKCDFAVDDEVYGGIEGAKRVLRIVADGLGMVGAAREKKRAIQFGARTAKMQSGHFKGTATI